MSEETYKREIPIYQIRLQYAYESQGYVGKTGETTYNPMTYFVKIHDNYTPGGLPLRVDVDHVARRAEVAKTGSYWDLNETAKPTANALVLATPGGALTYVLPSEFAPYVHNHDERYYTQAQTTSFLAGKSDVGHSHNDLYYTESEIDWLLGFKSNDGHAHDERYYTESEIDTMFSGIESLWTDAGGGEYQSAAVWLHLNNPSFYKAIRFSDAGANIHEMQIDYDTGFKFISENHNFYMNSETGLFTTDSINAGGIAYPTAPPASDKLILVSASGATSYIDVPASGGGDYSHLTDNYVPMKAAGSNALRNSLFYLDSLGMMTRSLFQVWPSSSTSAGVLADTNHGHAIIGHSNTKYGGSFRSQTGIGCNVESPYGIGLEVASGGAQITGTTTINGITYPSTDGTAGQFLQTNGSGQLVWATIGTGVTGTYTIASITGFTVEAGRITSVY